MGRAASCKAMPCGMANGNRKSPEKRAHQHRARIGTGAHPGYEIGSGLRAEWGRPLHWNNLSGRTLPEEKEISERFNKKLNGGRIMRHNIRSGTFRRLRLASRVRSISISKA